MDIVFTNHVHDELRREVAIRRLTTELTGYATEDLEGLVDLLLEQRKKIPGKIQQKIEHDPFRTASID